MSNLQLNFKYNYEKTKGSFDDFFMALGYDEILFELKEIRYN